MRFDEYDEDQAAYESWWAKVWKWWLIAVAGTFAVLEGIALIRRRQGDTLSERIRKWLKITNRRRLTAGAIGLGVALVAFVAWFWPHIVFEVW